MSEASNLNAAEASSAAKFTADDMADFIFCAQLARLPRDKRLLRLERLADDAYAILSRVEGRSNIYPIWGERPVKMDATRLKTAALARATIRKIGDLRKRVLDGSIAGVRGDV
jgi:hypothetical protein